MKKTVLFILILLSLVVLMLRFGNLAAESIFNIQPKMGLRVLSTPEGAKIFLDNQEVGQTPYESEELSKKEYLVKLELDQMSWQGRVNLSEGTLTVVNRDLSTDPTSAAGEVLTLEKGKGVTVLSTPQGSEVEVNGNLKGKTPVSFDLEAGEHIFVISQPGYLKRSIRAYLPLDHNLTLNVDLALTEADLTNIPTPVITQTPKVVVKNTPTGFLRVREKPALNGKEVARVSPGEELVLLEELTGWVKVRLSSGVEGYVSSQYVEKKTQL